MTPAALGGAEPDASEPHTTLPPDTTELLQRAFQQGAEYALQQQAEEQAEERRKQEAMQAQRSAVPGLLKPSEIDDDL